MTWIAWLFLLLSLGTLSAWFFMAALALFAEVGDYHEHQQHKQSRLHDLWEKVMHETQSKR